VIPLHRGESFALNLYSLDASMNYWLLKSEPITYSIDRLAEERETLWDGVRNYQARNFLQQMQVGDRAFFYHSNCPQPGIVGLVEIQERGIIDPTQFDPHSAYYDPKSTPEKPRWQTVKVRFQQKLSPLLSLTDLKARFSPDEFLLVRKGNRLSVMPVAEKIALVILAQWD